MNNFSLADLLEWTKISRQPWHLKGLFSLLTNKSKVNYFVLKLHYWLFFLPLSPHPRKGFQLPFSIWKFRIKYQYCPTDLRLDPLYGCVVLDSCESARPTKHPTLWNALFQTFWNGPDQSKRKRFSDPFWQLKRFFFLPIHPIFSTSLDAKYGGFLDVADLGGPSVVWIPPESTWDPNSNPQPNSGGVEILTWTTENRSHLLHTL